MVWRYPVHTLGGRSTSEEFWAEEEALEEQGLWEWVEVASCKLEEDFGLLVLVFELEQEVEVAFWLWVLAVVVVGLLALE